MNERAEPELARHDDEFADVEEFVESFSDEAVAEAAGCNEIIDTSTAKKSISPTFFTMLHFHKGFCDYTFNNHFDFLKRNDMYLGKGTFGHLSRFMPVQIYLMKKELDELRAAFSTDEWKKLPEFKEYANALDGIPPTASDKEKNCADMAFFKQLHIKFFDRYEKSLTDHLLTRWRTNKLVWYCLGGDENVAKEFAIWLVNAKNAGVATNEEGEAINNPEGQRIPHSNDDTVEVMLCNQHQPTDPSAKRVKINVNKCMEFLTKNADAHKILKDDFIIRNWEHIEKLATSTETVKLFELKKKDGPEHDISTWGDYDFHPFIDSIWQEVSIHAHHQQRCENYVQMSNLVSKTMVREARRTWRAIIVSTIIRRFNQWAVDRADSEFKSNEKKKEMMRKKLASDGKPIPKKLEAIEDYKPKSRVEGAKRIEYFTIYIRTFIKARRKARNELEEELIDQLRVVLQEQPKRQAKTNARRRKRLSLKVSSSI